MSKEVLLLKENVLPLSNLVFPMNLTRAGVFLYFGSMHLAAVRIQSGLTREPTQVLFLAYDKRAM